MDMNDSREIAAEPEVVWAALLDPEVLKACIPGCTEMTGSPEAGYEATVVQKVGPVKATFKGAVRVEDVEEGRAVTLSGEGKGGPAGFAKGEARVTLEPSGEGTRLTYAASAKVGGKLAQLGGRVIDGVARRMADDFFARFQEAVEGPAEAEAAAPLEATPEGEAPQGAARKGWFRRRAT